MLRLSSRPEKTFSILPGKLLRKHLPANSQNSGGRFAPTDSPNVGAVKTGPVVSVTNYEHRHAGKTIGKFPYEGGDAHPGATQSYDYQSQRSGKFGILHANEGFGCVSCAFNLIKLPLQHGFSDLGLQGIIVDQQDRGRRPPKLLG